MSIILHQKVKETLFELLDVNEEFAVILSIIGHLCFKIDPIFGRAFVPARITVVPRTCVRFETPRIPQHQQFVLHIAKRVLQFVTANH